MGEPMKISRQDILKRLITKEGYQSYLEIGVSSGRLYKHIPLKDKTGVDPAWRAWYLLARGINQTTSDEFFAKNSKDFDLVFVDGLHEARQAHRDIVNALSTLRPNGTIVMHDCLPKSKEQQAVPRVQRSWTGDVWRAFVKASQNPSLTTLILDTDSGCGVIRSVPRPADAPAPPIDIDPLDESVTWEDFDANKDSWVRIVPEDEIYTALDSLSNG